LRLGQEVQALPRQAELTPAVPRIHVVAGVLEDAAGRVLVAQRPAGKSLAGGWEFPGGKLLASEERVAGLARELEEELGIRIEPASCRPLIRYLHAYPELEVLLDVFRVGRWSGAPQCLEHQALDWRPPDALLSRGLLPADAPIVNALRLPAIVAVTPAGAEHGEAQFMDAIEVLAERTGDALICLRRPDLAAARLVELAGGVACRLEGTGARLLLHGEPVALLSALESAPAGLAARLEPVLAGIHMPGRCLETMTARPVPRSMWWGVSCHDAAQLAHAAAIGADYAFLGHVAATASHPGRPGMGWDRFARLVGDLPLPAYAIGGLGPQDLETAWAQGAQGIAAIRGLWPAG
jgi:8-oxo-dGTP diphosphatase